MGAIGSKHGSAVVQQQDLNNKVAIVTGPTTGIGYETSLMLASVGCHVVLAGRGQSRLDKIASDMTQTLAKTHPNIKPQLTSIELDLSNFTSIHSFVNKFQALNLPCHYLFNNAGVMMTDYKPTSEGFELQVGTNCIGHQYLTNLLLPILIASAPSRVIWTSSMGHQFSDYNVKGGEAEVKRVLYPTEKQYSRTTWYGHTKIGNIYQAREITRRYGSHGVISLACHPGVVATELGKQTWYNNVLYKGFAWTMKNSNQGAATQLWASVDDEWPKHINEPAFSFYSKDCHIAKPAKRATDAEWATLWYDVNDAEIAKAATKLGLSLGVTPPPVTATSAPTTPPQSDETAKPAQEEKQPVDEIKASS